MSGTNCLGFSSGAKAGSSIVTSILPGEVFSEPCNIEVLVSFIYYEENLLAFSKLDNEY